MPAVDFVTRNAVDDIATYYWRFSKFALILFRQKKKLKKVLHLRIITEYVNVISINV